jgi:hypothetical protein
MGITRRMHQFKFDVAEEIEAMMKKYEEEEKTHK